MNTALDPLTKILSMTREERIRQMHNGWPELVPEDIVQGKFYRLKNAETMLGVVSVTDGIAKYIRIDPSGKITQGVYQVEMAQLANWCSNEAKPQWTDCDPPTNDPIDELLAKWGQK